MDSGMPSSRAPMAMAIPLPGFSFSDGDHTLECCPGARGGAQSIASLQQDFTASHFDFLFLSSARPALNSRRQSR